MPQLYHSPSKLGLQAHEVKPSESLSTYIRALTGTELESVEAVRLASLAWVLEVNCSSV